MSNNKKLGVNFIFSFVKTLMGIIFPLITFPYALRVLGPDRIGKVDYAQATITYFTLISAFGILNYAIREGARIREDKEKIQKFASQMYSINMITMLISYIFCAIIISLPLFANYRWLLVVFSSTMFLTTIGVEWIYNIYEDYVYISIRTVIFQLVSLILLFLFVKDSDDYIIYAAISVFSNVGSNIFNYFRSKKYVKLKLHFDKELFVHIKPMILIFFMNVASSIYLIMDRSMLGLITKNNDTEVGLYSAAVKIVTVVVTLIATLRTVMLPRVSYYMENGTKTQVKDLNYSTGKMILMMSIPSVIGLFCLSDSVILLFAGEKYIETTITLKILLIDIIFATLNGFIVNQLLISYRKEGKAALATFIGAGVNLVLNALTIPIWGRNGAALSTCAAEMAIFIFICIVIRKEFSFIKLVKTIVQCIIGSMGIVIVYLFSRMIFSREYIIMIVTIAFGALAYVILLLLMKNDTLCFLISTIRKKSEKSTDK